MLLSHPPFHGYNTPSSPSLVASLGQHRSLNLGENAGARRLLPSYAYQKLRQARHLHARAPKPANFFSVCSRTQPLLVLLHLPILFRNST